MTLQEKISRLAVDQALAFLVLIGGMRRCSKNCRSLTRLLTPL